MNPHTTTQILPIDNIDRLARTLVTGDPAVTTIGRESPCPCQTYLESMPTTPFATEELEKEFWSKLHNMMPQRDAEEEMNSQKWQRRQRRARELESGAKEGKKKGKKSAQKTLTDSSDSDDRRDRERRQQRSGGGTAVESVAERAESDRKRREDEPPVANAQKVRGWIQESGKEA